jgi:GNAT superfamily N-acetyltransferase
MSESRPSSYPGVTLRALEERDGDFLFRLFIAARPDLSAAVSGWSAAERDALLRMQFDARETQYARDHPDACVEVILSSGEPIGGVCVALLRDELRIVDLTLLPEYRNRGIGRALLADLLDEAGRTGRRVTLHVQRGNPARCLYERLGFVASGERGLHTFMQWPKPLVAVDELGGIS